MFIKYLFPSKPSNARTSTLLLAARIVFGLLFMTHGVQKWSNWSELSATFPDPLGIGSSISLGLVIFAELACSIAVIFGMLYRLALLPMIFTMAIACFVIHANSSFFDRELPLIYLTVFIFMFITGPGKFSLDWLLGKEINKKRK